MKKIILILTSFYFSLNLIGQQIHFIPVIDGPDKVCVQKTYSYTLLNPPVGATVFEWEALPQLSVQFTPNAPSATPQVDVFFYNDSYSGSLVVKAGNTSGYFYFDTLDITVFRSILNQPPLKMTGQDHICLYPPPDSVMYICDSVGEPTNVSSYYWEAPQGAIISSGQGNDTVYIKYSTNAISDYLKVSACNSCDTSSPLSSQIYIDPHVEVKITEIKPEPSSWVCLGETIYLTAIALGAGDTAIYIWRVNGSQTYQDTINNTFSYTPNNNQPINIQCLLISSARCHTPDTAILETIIQASLTSYAGTLIPSNTTICQNSTTESISLSDNAVGNIIRWMILRPGSVKWDTLPYSLTTKKINIETESLGSVGYKASVRSGPCPPDFTQEIFINVVSSPIIIDSIKPPLVFKADTNYHDYPDSIMIICQGCAESDKEITYLYTWGYVDAMAAEHTMGKNSRKQFWIYKYDSLNTQYFLKVSNGACEIPLSISNRKFAPGYRSYFIVFPNPNNGNFELVIDAGNPGTATITIYDLFGREQRRFKFDKKDTAINIPVDISNLKQGLYVVEVGFASGERLIKKILVY